MHVRRVAIAAAIAAAALLPVLSAAPGIADAAPGKPAKVTAKPTPPTKPKPTPVVKPKPTAPVKPTAPAKPVKPAPVNFAATGTLTAVNVAAGTVTVAVKGGTPDVHGRTVTFPVPSLAKVTLDGAAATLSTLPVGYRVSVTGDRVDTAYRVVKLNASTPAPETTPSPTTPATEPTTPVVEPTA